MKKIIPLSLLLALFSCNEKNIENNDSLNISSTVDSVSYVIGTNIGQNLIKDFPEINLAFFNQGIKSQLDSTIELKIDLESGQKLVQSFFMKKQQLQSETEKEKLTPLIKQGEEFLANNSKKEGVITLPSGLQYEVINEGKGPKPALTNEVETHYHGTLLDGTVFDSSVDRGEPVSFPVNGVIPGWTEALQLMNVGSKWKLYIPYQLAYGERGQGPIGPYSTLIFEVELLKIIK